MTSSDDCPTCGLARDRELDEVYDRLDGESRKVAQLEAENERLRASLARLEELVR